LQQPKSTSHLQQLAMFRQKIDLHLTGASSASRTEAPKSGSQIQLSTSFDVDPAGIHGWYRMKVFSPAERLHRISIEALDNDNVVLCVFETLTAKDRFSSYIYLGLTLSAVRLRFDFTDLADPDARITLRPISITEFVWHSLRSGFAYRPAAFLSFFRRPEDPFQITFSYPSPPQFETEDKLYHWWIENREQSALDRPASRVDVGTAEPPTVSILMTVCDPPPNYLAKAIESVFGQTAPNWELLIADDASVNSEVRNLLRKAEASDARVKLMLREARGGISAATNSAMAAATSPFVFCLDHDDMLAPAAVRMISTRFAAKPNLKLLYSDEDKIDQHDNRFKPYFKSDFSRELLYSYNYINHITAYHADTVRNLGGWRSRFDGAQDYDLNLRMVAGLNDADIDHVPAVLYHWRAIPGSAAMSIGFKQYAINAGKLALAEHFQSLSIPASIETVADTMYRVRYGLPEPQPSVSIVIPFRDKPDLLRQVVSSIFAHTSYRNYEIILLDNGSTADETLQLLDVYRRDSRVVVIQSLAPFNYSALNNLAAQHSRADYLCLLNNDTEVINSDWLEDMVGYAIQPGVGCVGAKLLYANGSVQHAGVVIGLGGVALHVFHHRLRDDHGYFGRLRVASNYSALTGACLLVKRDLYLAVGGLDESNLAVAFNDIDLCLRIQNAGFRNVFTPFAELYHFECSSRGTEDTPEKKERFQKEVAFMKSRYGDALDQDRFYSPHLTLTKGDFSIATE
jgi:GT2 family glycosyltransferase